MAVPSGRVGPVAARLLRLRVGIPLGGWMFVCCECCVLFFCQETVPSTGRSFVQRNTIECGVSDCDNEALIMRRPWSTGGCYAIKKTNLLTDWQTNVWSGAPFKFRR